MRNENFTDSPPGGQARRAQYVYVSVAFISDLARTCMEGVLRRVALLSGTQAHVSLSKVRSVFVPDNKHGRKTHY